MGEHITLGTWITYNLMMVLILADLRQNSAITLPPIYWNTSNPMFKSSSKDPSFEVHLDDQIDFVCPYNPVSYSSVPKSSSASPATSTPLSNNSTISLVLSDNLPLTVPSIRDEYYIIYQVSKSSYDTCTVQKDDRVLLNCSNPRSPKRFTVLFELFQSIPNAPEFRYGESYYYISTSTGDLEGLQNTKLGVCRTHNLRLVVHVCCSTTTTPSIFTNMNSSTLRPASTPATPGVASTVPGVDPSSFTTQIGANSDNSGTRTSLPSSMPPTSSSTTSSFSSTSKRPAHDSQSNFCDRLKYSISYLIIFLFVSFSSVNSTAFFVFSMNFGGCSR